MRGKGKWVDKGCEKNRVRVRVSGLVKDVREIGLGLGLGFGFGLGLGLGSG
jgi:hypothetical protein